MTLTPEQQALADKAWQSAMPLISEIDALCERILRSNEAQFVASGAQLYCIDEVGKFARDVAKKAVTAALAQSAQPADRAVSPAQPRWRHIKRGTTYTEIGRGLLQTDAPIGDETPCVIYRSDDGRLWPRPVAEFEDGRFERLADAPAVQEAVVDDLAALVRRLVRDLRKAAPGNELAGKALGYLNRKGLGGNVLRNEVALGIPPEPEPEAPDADEDLICVPRGLIGAACTAISQKRDAPRLLAKLRRYTVGDLAAPAAPAVQEAVAWQPPWSMPPLCNWAIVGMNHYHQNGIRHLFVAMMCGARCIQVEGSDEAAVWDRLRTLAMLPAPTQEQPK